MGLQSSVQEIIQMTQKVSSLGGIFHTGANIPATKLTSAFGIEGDIPLNSLSDIKDALGEVRQGVATAATVAYCAYVMTLDGLGQGQWGSNMLNRWGGLMANAITGAAGVLMDMYKQIADAVAAQVGMAVSQIVGMITNIVNAFSNMISSIILLAKGIYEMFKNWSDWADWIWEVEIEAENCKDMLSAIGACYLNKFLGPYIEQFTDKIVGAINEAGNNLNELLFDQFQDVNMLASYVNQEAFLLQKASLQIKGLTKENLLGGREYTQTITSENQTTEQAQ